MKKFLIYVSAGLLFASCNSYLDIAPENNITEEQIMEILNGDNETKKERIFSGMSDALVARFHGGNGAGSDGRYNSVPAMNVMRSIEANDVCFGQTDRSGQWGWDEYNDIDYTPQSSDKNIWYWKTYWDNIVQANKMLDFLTEELLNTSKSTKLKEYKAVGLTIRAFSYHYLMETYQDEYLQGGKDKLGLMLYDFYSPLQPYKVRASADDTYTFIKKDLADAMKLFAEAGTTITDNTEDLDLAVINFVLARVSLCTGDWKTTIDACDVILSKYNKFIPDSTYGATLDAKGFCYADSNAFTNNAINPEVFMGWKRETSSTAHIGWYNIFGESYGGVAYQTYMCIDERLYNKIADTDFRKRGFLDHEYGIFKTSKGTSGVIPKYANLKFGNSHGLTYEKGDDTKRNANAVTDYVMRASEVLLMKAEAQAQSGNSNTAKTTLNILLAARTKKGEAPLTCDTYPSMNGMTALEMVQLQTRIEMWGEKAVEFLNNKRWNIPMDTKSSQNHPVKKARTVSGMTCQIPEDEMINNPLCVQN